MNLTDWKHSMSSFYRSREERLRDVVLASMNVETSLRYSLTEGGRMLPFTDSEKQAMREAQAQAIARLAIDRAMQAQRWLPDFL